MSEPAAPPSVPEVGPTRVSRRTMFVCSAIVAVAAAWALRPLAPTAKPAQLEEAPQSVSQGPARLALDVDAFRAPIWVQAPQLSQAPPDAAPLPPLRIQLLAILREGDIYKAALYDPDADRLFIVASGESVAGRTVDRVLADAVALRDGGGGEVLTLARSAGGAP